MNERLARAEVGAKHDAERMRKHDVILGLLYEEARRGKLYTLAQFSEAFENTGGLGGRTIVHDRLSVLATKGKVKFIRGPATTRIGLAAERSKYGYLCVEGMLLGTGGEDRRSRHGRGHAGADPGAAQPLQMPADRGRPARREPLRLGLPGGGRGMRIHAVPPPRILAPQHRILARIRRFCFPCEFWILAFPISFQWLGRCFPESGRPIPNSAPESGSSVLDQCLGADFRIRKTPP